MRHWNGRKNALFLLIAAALVLCAVAVAGGLLSGQAMVTDFTRKNLAPCGQFLFGTDWMGRDMLSRTLTGLSLSIRIGLLTAAVSAVIALVLGVASAVLGGWVDAVISWCIDLVMGIPHILLVMLITRSPFYWTILLVWAPLLLLLAFCCGMAVLLSALAVYFRDLQYLYGILTMAWMYATPLFYPLSALPPFMVPVIKLNPLYHYINCMRCLVMYGTVPGPNTWIACIGSAVVMMSVGLAAFRKLQRNFILYL